MPDCEKNREFPNVSVTGFSCKPFVLLHRIKGISVIHAWTVVRPCAGKSAWPPYFRAATYRFARARGQGELEIRRYGRAQQRRAGAQSCCGRSTASEEVQQPCRIVGDQPVDTPGK